MQFTLYVPGNSWMHRLDPVSKVLLTAVEMDLFTRLEGKTLTGKDIGAALGLHFSVTPEKSVVRLGTIQPVKQAHVAEAAAGHQ